MLYHCLSIKNASAMAAVLPNQKRTVSAAFLDRTGICVSVLCLVQCLLLPLLVVAAPVLSVPFLDTELFHLLLLGLIVPIAAAAFYLGYRAHANRSTVAIGGAGIAVVLATAVLGHDHLSPMVAASWTALGGVLLIIAHLLNLRHRRRVGSRPRL
jgi:predicted neutral ceramidase superfamily lipid hydrolase